MIKNSKPRRSEFSNPDDSVVKRRNADGTCDPNKMYVTEKGSRITKLKSPAESSSSDSIWDADNLINVIDGIEGKFGNQKQEALSTRANSLQQRPVPVYDIGTLQKHIPLYEKAASENGPNTSKKKINTTSKVNVIDSAGEIDLDALEKWASTPNIQIDWSIEKAVVGFEKAFSVPKAGEEKILKSDIAVKEIDDILDTLSETNDAAKGQSKNTRHAKCELAMDRKVTPSPSESLSVSIPTVTWSQPLQAIRLPPLKGSTFGNEDIFHRKIDDMSLLHVPRVLPKLGQSGQKQQENIQQCIKQSRSRLPGKEPVGSCIETRSPYQNIDILLPGQVSEINFDAPSQQTVPVRTIVLDYASTNHDKGKKRGKNARQRKICKLFRCCMAAEDEGNVYEFDAAQNSKASFEEIQIAIVEEAPQRSLPRRIWARLKSLFGI